MKFTFLTLAVLALPAVADDLKPLMTVPGEIVVQDDFSKSGPLEKKGTWTQRQHTRWEMKDGVLFGQPSTTEFQASVKNHKGFEPRMSVPTTPEEFAASFSIQFMGGEETAICPFVEFGHHICRLKFSAEGGLKIVVEGEMFVVAEATDFKFEDGKTYRVFAEMKGDEFVVQFADGPTLYAKHESFSKPSSSGGKGFGVAGTKDGTVKIDDITIWNVKSELQSGWEKRRAEFPAFKPVATGKKPKAKKSKSAAKK